MRIDTAIILIILIAVRMVINCTNCCDTMKQNTFTFTFTFKCITTVCIFFVKELVELVARDVSELLADMSVGLRFFEFIFS